MNNRARLAIRFLFLGLNIIGVATHSLSLITSSGIALILTMVLLPYKR